MYKSIKNLSAACACVALFVGASASAETVWKPPAEIAPKAEAGADAGAAGAAAAGGPAAATPAATESKADKEKRCNDEAAAKGLKGKAKRLFKAECTK
jgi:hypothetical protein